jgi:N-formylmaleamate deformylase
MSQWSSNSVEVNGARLHYHRTGGEKPQIMLLHGFSDNGLCWKRVAIDLAGSYDVIMPDARGHGLSAAIRSAETLDMAGDVAGLIQALGLERPVLMGHSMGANTAAATAARYPELVGALVLEDPPWHIDDPHPPEAEPGALNPFEQWLVELRSKSLPEVMAAGRAANPTWPEVEMEAWADSKLQLDMKIFKISPDFTDWRKVVPKIGCPMLLITADPTLGGRVTPEVAHQVAALCPSCQVAQIPGAGHNIRREQYVTYLQIVKDFLLELYPR